MKTLDFVVTGPDGARTEQFTECLTRTLVAATAGFGVAPRNCTGRRRGHVAFFLGPGGPDFEADCVVDLSPTCWIATAPEHGGEFDHNLRTHPTYSDVLVSGEPLPPSPRDKMARLDSDEMTFAVVVADDYDWRSVLGDLDGDRVLTESQILSDRSVLDEVSHALLVSPDGATPLLCERAVAHRVCVIFYVGDDSDGAMGRDRTVLCTSLDDFFERAQLMAKDGLSPGAFEAKVLPWVFSEDSVTGRETRSWLGSLLADKTGDDFGLLELHRADDRLMRKVRGNAD